jgi:AbrB family looped-hinge helix DNA binding protein
MINGMQTTIDSAGRIVIPRGIREAAGLEPGTSVEVRVVDGVVSIEPAHSEVRIVRRGRLKVAMKEGKAAPLSEAVARAVRNDIRKRR